MAFSWPDPISFAADVVTFVGVPTLAWSTWKLWQDRKRDRAEEAERRIEATHEEIVSQGCLEFYDTDSRAGINLIPFKKAAGLPRPGDFVSLPGETHRGQTFGAGEYEVESVSFSFQEAPEITDQPCPAIPSKVVVYVHKRVRN